MPGYMRPGFKMPAGSKAAFSLADSDMSEASSGWNTSTLARDAGSARIRVAWPPNSASVRLISMAPASEVSSVSSQTRPPPQS